MNKHELAIFLVSLIFTGFSALAQVTKIENTQLQLEGDNLIITYDVTGAKALENVWLDVKTTSNKTITAKTLSGDIGKNISVGKGKRIIWNMKADGIDLQGEELNVKVLASQPNNSNTLTDISEKFIPEKQSKKRDIVMYKNGVKLTGKLDSRFSRNPLKFQSNDGNYLTITQDEIEKIKNNGYSKDSVYLKNGDILYGTITEIYPNDKIKLKSKNNDSYTIQCGDIKSVSTYNTVKGGFYIMPLVQFYTSNNEMYTALGVPGLRGGFISNWGGYVQYCNSVTRRSTSELLIENFEFGITKQIFQKSPLSMHIAFALNVSKYTSSSSYYYYNYNISTNQTGLAVSYIVRSKNFLFDVGLAGNEQNFIGTFGIGYSF